MVNLKDALRYVFQESSCLGLQLKIGVSKRWIVQLTKRERRPGLDRRTIPY
ncbi:9962_t:CDS:2 [Funneliformis mosseae]|uniref:9962_t:CDS:1 n=1 Tax=Funneliformis mosseae TaxID=27381 RepID=A0A9N9AKI1_FUNMO|nr:9962_t:CDS:2 [Funneliformis mosseae]